MTVQEMIDRLEKIQDKSTPVWMFDDQGTTWPAGIMGNKDNIFVIAEHKDGDNE